MNTNWDDLKYLLAVADHTTMSGAAERLGTNATTVSRRVKRLESEFGVPLLERSGEGWRPTLASRNLVDTARSVDLAIAAAENDVVRESGALTGTIVISGFPFVNDMALAPHLREFLDRFPQLDVELEYTTKVLSLALGEADLAIRVARPTEGKLVIRKLATFPIGLYQTRGAPQSSRWLGLTRNFDDGAHMQLAYKHFTGPPAARHHALHSLCVAMVESGLPGPLPTCIARTEPDLVPVIPRQEFSSNSIWLAYHENRRTDPRIMRANEWLAEIFPNPRKCICGKCN